MPRELLCCTLAFLVVAGTGTRAMAQGTSGRLPSPVSSRDLDLYGETLQLTPSQRDAIDTFHEQYREDFRVLREQEIEQYLQEVSGFWGRGFGSFDREAIKDSLQELSRLMSRIRLLDDRLFDQVGSVLTDDQAVDLPRVMQARDRQRYQTGGSRMAGFGNRAARVDLSRLYAALKLTEQERETTEPFVIQYEGRLSGATKELYVATTKIFLNLADSLQEQGISFDDPASMMENRRRMREVMRTAFADAMKEPLEKASSISDLNLRSLRQINELLATGTAITLRDRYLRRAYPEVPRTSASAAYRSYQAALHHRDLAESVRSDVKTAATQFRSKREVVVGEMIDAIDENRKSWTPMGGNRADREDRQAKLEAFRERLAAIDQAGLDALYAMIGTDLAATIRAAVATGSLADNEAAGGTGGGAFGAAAANGRGADGAAAPRLGPDPYLPTPITRRDIAAFRDRLELGDTDWYVLESLHEEYVESFNRIRLTDIAALRAAEAALEPSGDEENAAPPSPEQIDAVYELRARALKSIQQIDALLFDDIETLLATPRQQSAARRIRAARDRFVYNRGAGESAQGLIFSGGGNRRQGDAGRGNGRRGRGRSGRRWALPGGGSMEASVDLATLVDGLVDDPDLDDEKQTEVEKLLVEYEATAGDGLRRQYEAAMTIRREAQKLRAQMARRTADGDEDRQRGRGRWQAYRDLMEADGRKADEARQFMIDLNRGTVDALTEVLPANLAETLRDSYNRRAFPGIYDEPRATGRYLIAALELTDLQDQQRARVEAVRAEYEPDHREIADRMRDVYIASTGPAGADRERWRAFQSQRNKLDVLEFDRREINARALRQLRDILTDKQETRLRLPSDATTGDDDLTL